MSITYLSGSFSLVAEIGWLARKTLWNNDESIWNVSVSLPRLGGWREGMYTEYFNFWKFQSRCRDWVVGENLSPNRYRSPYPVSVSLPRLGGWRGSGVVPSLSLSSKFQSRCRDWVVGEFQPPWRLLPSFTFQSRCRDWVVGESNRLIAHTRPSSSFSLVAEIGWLASLAIFPAKVFTACFSLVAEIGWLARLKTSST